MRFDFVSFFETYKRVKDYRSPTIFNHQKTYTIPLSYCNFDTTENETVQMRTTVETLKTKLNEDKY